VESLDSRALFAVYGGNHGPWGLLMIALTAIGAGWTALGLVPLLWIARTRAFGVALALVIAVQAVLVVWLKAAIGRVRPWLAFGLAPPIGHPHDGSFPSGHAAGSFSVAAFLVVVLPALLPGSRGRARLLALLGLVLAASIALSRVYLGAHFPSDVLGGALLGAAVGAAGAKLYLARG
jgi:undecaprenyl-diphosphatase